MGRRDLYVLKSEGSHLISRHHPGNGISHYLVSSWSRLRYPVNETAALVWNCCSECIRVAELVQELIPYFSETDSLESDVLELLEELQANGLLTLNQQPYGEPSDSSGDLPVLKHGDSKHWEHADCAIVITVHNHISRFGLPCLEAVIKHSGSARIYLYDNESLDPDIRELKKFADDQPNVDFICIDDQEAFGGLTGTWNDGIARARRAGLRKVVLLNHDVIVGDTWGNFIRAIESDFFIYGPLTDRPGGAGAGLPQSAEIPLFDGLKETDRLMGFCIGFTLGRPELKLFDSWRFFEPELPFGGNEFGIQNRMKWRSKKCKSVVVTDCWVHHFLNMGWKSSPRISDPFDPHHNDAKPPDSNYITSFNDSNISHILRREILPLSKVDQDDLKCGDLFIVEDGIDQCSLSQEWRAFVLASIFRRVEYIRAEDINRLPVTGWLRDKSDFVHQDYIEFPPNDEYVRLIDTIREGAGVSNSENRYVLLNQRPENNRYLVESETSLPLEHYLHRALAKRGIPFQSCDFGMMSPAEQAQICGGALIFISVHGAALSNIIFTPRDCMVLEYNFRKFWYCDPVCDRHFCGELADDEQCHGKLTKHPCFHKADYHNLCYLLGRSYSELEAVRYEGRKDRNPISRCNLFVDGDRLVSEIEKHFSWRHQEPEC